jgi:hypothetical protein
MRARSSRPVLSLVVLATVGALAVGGCSSDAPAAGPGGGSGSATPASGSASPSASSTVAVPDGVQLTDQGSKLSFGDPARVAFETTGNRGSVLALTVRSVRRGRLSDFKGFILDDAYKQKAAYYYARVTVRNVGASDVGGVQVPLWGVNAAGTLLPAVNFTAGFQPCPSKQLPTSFGPGDSLRTCLVYLSPDKGSLDALSYRPSQSYDPITWTGTVAPPAKAPKKAPKKAPRKAQGSGRG